LGGERKKKGLGTRKEGERGGQGGTVVKKKKAHLMEDVKGFAEMMATGKGFSTIGQRKGQKPQKKKKGMRKPNSVGEKPKRWGDIQGGRGLGRRTGGVVGVGKGDDAILP